MAPILPVLLPTAKKRGAATPFPLCTSQEKEWCWAACGEMLSRKTHSQGTIVNKELGRMDCDFPRPVSKSCITSISDSAIEALAKTMLGYGNCNLVGSDISFSDLETQINSHQVVEAGFTWTATRLGHVVLVVDTDDTSGIEKVTLHDPDKSKALVNLLFTDLQKAYGFGVWDASWIDMY